MKVSSPTKEDAVALMGVARGQGSEIVGQKAVVEPDRWTFRTQELDDSAEEVEPSGEVSSQGHLMESSDRGIVEGLVASSGAGQPPDGAAQLDAGTVYADVAALLVQGVEDERGVSSTLRGAGRITAPLEFRR